MLVKYSSEIDLDDKIKLYSFTGELILLKECLSNNSVDKSDLEESFVNSAFNGQSEITKYFLDKGFIIPKTTPEIIFYSIAGLKEELAKEIKKGFNVNAITGSGQTALMSAVRLNHFEIAKILIENGANIHLKDNSQLTALDYSAINGNFEMFEFLVSNGANIKTKAPDYDGFYRGFQGGSVLDNAISGGNVNIINMLVEKGIDLNKSKTPALLWMSSLGISNLVKNEIEKNQIDINVVNEEDETPLIIAIKNGHKEIALMLIQRGANTKARDKYNKAALSYAKENGFDDIVEAIVNQPTT